jgi:SAM-dependent methyltransferase
MSINPPTKLPKSSRLFNWVSSTTTSPQLLELLQEKMTWFYGSAEGRENYQSMLDQKDNWNPPTGSVGYEMTQFIINSDKEKILEIGCGSGQIYNYIYNSGFKGDYTGIDVPAYIINHNQEKYPQAKWLSGLVYQIPFEDSHFDICFSFYVLEHLVYPEKGLLEMLRVVKPGGYLILVFPDFVETGHLGSQQLGFSHEIRAMEKIKKGRLIDGLITFYDSRFRLPAALKKAREKHGSFPINIAPKCLDYPDVMSSDIDAIYIASKQEINEWAIQKGLKTVFPAGTKGDFREHSFIVIHK